MSSTSTVSKISLNSLRIATFAISIGLWGASLTLDCFYAGSMWGPGYFLLGIGWLGPLIGIIAWYANPALIVGWYTLWRKQTVAISFFSALLALLLILSFQFRSSILINQGGGKAPIISLKAGYWLWFGSAFCLSVGTFILGKIEGDLAKGLKAIFLGEQFPSGKPKTQVVETHSNSLESEN